jgi:hypothetical protein
MEEKSAAAAIRSPEGKAAVSRNCAQDFIVHISDQPEMVLQNLVQIPLMAALRIISVQSDALKKLEFVRVALVACVGFHLGLGPKTGTMNLLHSPFRLLAMPLGSRRLHSPRPRGD